MAEKHGGWKSHRRMYQCWQDMKSRCLNPSCHNFKNYGARGITVCDRWRESFSAFFGDMGPMPDGMTIERIDVDGNYEPSNCKWADRGEQRRNMRDCMHITMNGMTMTPQEWARQLDIHSDTIRRRKRRGMSDEAALTSPRERSNKYLAARSGGRK